MHVVAITPAFVQSDKTNEEKITMREANSDYNALGVHLEGKCVQTLSRIRDTTSDHVHAFPARQLSPELSK